LIETDETDIVVTGEHMLLLSCSVIPDGQETVIAGIDLETELHRIVSECRLVRPLIFLTGLLTQPLGQMFVDFAFGEEQIVVARGWVPVK
jgi:hypothetical protein